jgi:ribosomal protein S18 acetylase RimI-like enzyme
LLVRKLTGEDEEALWFLRLKALTDNPEAFAATLEETLASGRERVVQHLHLEEAFYIGAFESELIGMVFFRREEGRKNLHKGRILSMYVQPESRGHGVGKLLLQEVISQAKQIDGIEQLHLTVVTTNIAARSLYYSMGFEVYGTILQALKINEQYWDEEMMVLRLS